MLNWFRRGFREGKRGSDRGYMSVGTQVVGNEEEFFSRNREAFAIGLNVLRMRRGSEGDGEKAVFELLNRL